MTNILFWFNGSGGQRRARKVMTYPASVEMLSASAELRERITDDTQWQCTVCGRIGRVGRCCGHETRKPINEAASEEERRIKSAELRERITDDMQEWVRGLGSASEFQRYGWDAQFDPATLEPMSPQN